MLRFIVVLSVAVSIPAQAQTPPASSERKAPKEQELKKKKEQTIDQSLAGDVSRKKEKREAMPTLTYDAFRLQIEGQVASKRNEQIGQLKKIIELTKDKKEMPSLMFRLGELYWEESKYYFFEANRKDDEKIKAMNADDKAGIARAEAAKAELMGQSKEQARLAIEQYSRIVQEYRDFERTDEVLYFLGLNLMEMDDEKEVKRGLVAYKRLIEKYPKSRFLPDAFLAVGEYHFNNSKGKRDQLEKALENYKNAAKYTENAVYGYALYKQGWCYFNMGDFEKAMDMFKAVLLYAELAGTEEAEGGKKGTKGSRAGLVREARNDYVRAYSRGAGNSTEARERFAKLTKNPDELRGMMKALAELYYQDGRDKDAAVAYDMLIKERPVSPEAPGFQGRIVACVMRAGNKRMTVQQVRRLVKIVEDVHKGNPKLDAKDKKTLDEARDDSERFVSNLAVSWHQEAKKTLDPEVFGFANEVYADYLTLFPDNPKAYDLRFFWAELLNDNLNKYDRAAEEYTRVTLADIEKLEKGTKQADGSMKVPGKPGKFFHNAAYNAILAWDEVVKKATAEGKIKPEAITDPNKKLAIPAEKQALLQACERYLKYVEKGEKVVEIAYKVAKIYYDYNHLDEAEKRFSDIALAYPDHKFETGDRPCEISLNLVLDIHNLRQDSAKVNEWARRFRTSECLKGSSQKARDDMDELVEKSGFKLINQLDAKKEYAKAAELYMAFVVEFPKSDLVDKALMNAATDYYLARMLDKAIEVRKIIVNKYPKSQYVPASMYALAEGYEAITDFDSAADYYEMYATAYEKSAGKKARGKAPKKDVKDAKKAGTASEQVWEEQKAQDALFNAGIFREGLTQYKQALKDREMYLELWPESKDAEAVSKSIIDLYEKLGQWTRVQKELEEYERQWLRDPNKVLIAEGRIASIYEEKLKNPAGMRRIYKRILDYYEKLSKKQRESLEVLALDAVARATLDSNEADFRKYSALKLKWTNLSAAGEIRNSIVKKKKALDELQKTYTKTVALKSAEPAICALHKIGLAYDQFVVALDNPPIPKLPPKLPPEQAAELLVMVKAEFAAQSGQMRDTAMGHGAEAFAAAVSKSQELDVFNACTSASLDMLRKKYRPDQYPKMGEDIAELKVEASDFTAVGGDLLTTIQPIPIISPEKARELKLKARETGKDLADLREPAPESRALPPPPDLPKQSPTSTAAIPPKKESSSPTPSPTPDPKKNDAEPEEPL